MADSYLEINGRLVKLIDLGGDRFAWATSAAGGVGSAASLVAITSNAVVQAAAYAQEDLVGGKQSFLNVVEAATGPGIIRGILIGDQAKNTADNSKYNIVFFDADPTGTTFTENAQLDVADADLSKICGVAFFDASNGIGRQCNFADNTVFYGAVTIPFQLQSGTTLFMAMIVEGATGPTFVATTDLFVRLLIERL
jgi:hypothetical protein